jgi:ABC-2 type transport system permease protein
MQRIQTIIAKEWAEVFKNRVVLMTVAVLPLVFTLMPLAILYTMRSGTAGGGDSTSVPPQFEQMCAQTVGATGSECVEIFIINQFLLLYMMMPLAIPVAIAAYSIVGEKTTRSLEPLLATPITTEELLAAKGLAAAIPAILATWGAFVIFVLGMPLVGAPPVVYRSLASPTWLVAIFVVGPLMAVLAVNFAIIVSSRVNDPRTAEQVSMVIIVPLLGLLFGQIAGVLVLSAQLMLGVAAGLAVLDVGMVYLGARLFQREAILTRWK